jgi:hypothetical protein
MMAVEAGMTAAALQQLSYYPSGYSDGLQQLSFLSIIEGGYLQNLNWFSSAEHWVGGATKTVEGDVVKAADAAAPILKMVGKEAWKGATACYANVQCKAAVEKYGLKAVQASMAKKVMILMI